MDSSQETIEQPILWSPWKDPTFPEGLELGDLSPLRLSCSNSLLSEPTELKLDDGCHRAHDFDPRHGCSPCSSRMATWPLTKRPSEAFPRDPIPSSLMESLDLRLVRPQEDVTYKGMPIAPPELVSGPSKERWDFHEVATSRKPTVLQPRTKNIVPKTGTLLKSEISTSVPSTMPEQADLRRVLPSEFTSSGSEPDELETPLTSPQAKLCPTIPSDSWRCMPSTTTPDQCLPTPSLSPPYMDQVEAGNPALLTRLPVGKHIVRSPTNGGKVTMEIVPSSLTTSAETTASSTSSSKFWISTPSGWRRKEDLDNSKPVASSLPLPGAQSCCGARGPMKSSSSLKDVSTMSSSLCLENPLKRALSMSEFQTSQTLMPSYIRGPYLSKNMSSAGWKKIKLSKKQMKAINLDEFKEVKIFALF